MRLIARFGFEDLGLLRLELLIAVDNVASRRVAEKAGATYEGILASGPHGHGELRNDSYSYSLTRRSVERTAVTVPTDLLMRVKDAVAVPNGWPQEYTMARFVDEAFTAQLERLKVEWTPNRVPGGE